MRTITPTRRNVIVIKHLRNLIPRGIISGQDRQTGLEEMKHAFSVTSHFAAMLFGHLAHAMSHVPPDRSNRRLLATPLLEADAACDELPL